MRLKHYLLRAACALLLFGVFSVEAMAAKLYTPFQGRRSAWYFNEMDGRIATGLQGPFLDEASCLQKAKAQPSSNAEACYERETIAYFRWRQNQIRTWVLPVQTGDPSRHLIFPNRQDCHRVAQSGFYFTPGGVKVLQRPDLQTCIVALVYFDEIETRYAFLDQHPATAQPFPQRYRAWSMIVETGHYRKLLQFRHKSHCERVARDGKYYSFLPRTGFGQMRVTYLIPEELRQCLRRTAGASEVPVIYQHIEEHPQSAPPASAPALSEKTQSVWVLTLQKPGGPYSLFFQTKIDCQRVQQQRFYYREVKRGGFFPSIPIKTSFQFLQQECTRMELPVEVQERLYPFVDKH